MWLLVITENALKLLSYKLLSYQVTKLLSYQISKLLSYSVIDSILKRFYCPVVKQLSNGATKLFVHEVVK